MKAKQVIASFVLGTAAISSLTVGTAIAQSKITNQSKLSLNGIGLVKVGMTVGEASKASGTQLVRGKGYQGDACYYVAPKNGPQGLSFMVTGKRIARVDVSRFSSITTVSGAKIGDTEAKIKSLYPGQIQVKPHQYVQGHYLEFVPKSSADKNYRIVFETDGKKVTMIRAGKLPEAEFIEGCS